jgi:naphthoate synthase
MKFSPGAPFDPTQWVDVAGFEDLEDISYHRHNSLGVVRVGFSRPEVRNAFRPQTVDELYRALDHARMLSDVGVVLLTGNGPSPKDGVWAFCSVVTRGSGEIAAMSTLQAERADFIFSRSKGLFVSCQRL